MELESKLKDLDLDKNWFVTFDEMIKVLEQVYGKF